MITQVRLSPFSTRTDHRHSGSPQKMRFCPDRRTESRSQDASLPAGFATGSNNRDEEKIGENELTFRDLSGTDELTPIVLPCGRETTRIGDVTRLSE
jgi:hypothetical protein